MCLIMIDLSLTYYSICKWNYRCMVSRRGEKVVKSSCAMCVTCLSVVFQSIVRSGLCLGGFCSILFWMMCFDIYTCFLYNGFFSFAFTLAFTNLCVAALSISCKVYSFSYSKAYTCTLPLSTEGLEVYTC